MRNTKLYKKAKRASKTLALQTRLLKSLRVKNKNPACWLKSAAPRAYWHNKNLPMRVKSMLSKTPLSSGSQSGHRFSPFNG